MKLHGMATGFHEQLQKPAIAELCFEDRFAMMVEKEWTTQGKQKLAIRLKTAKLKWPTGIGKSYLAEAFAHKACREGLSAVYYSCPRLFRELAIANGDGNYLKLLNRIAKMDRLVIDDWGLALLNDS